MTHLQIHPKIPVAELHKCLFVAHTKSTGCEAALLHLVSTPSGTWGSQGHRGRRRAAKSHGAIPHTSMSRSQSRDPNLRDKLGRKCTGIYVWRSDHQQLCFSLLYISQYPFVPLLPQKPVLSTPKESTSSPLDLASSPGSLGDMQVSIKSGCGCSWPRHQWTLKKLVFCPIQCTRAEWKQNCRNKCSYSEKGRKRNLSGVLISCWPHFGPRVREVSWLALLWFYPLRGNFLVYHLSW